MRPRLFGDLLQIRRLAHAGIFGDVANRPEANGFKSGE
jgi:hypothetical protein